MRWKINRHGSPRGEVAPTPEQTSANAFFDWIEGLSARDNGKTCRMPMGQTATFFAHDVFDGGERFIREDGAWYFLPSLPTIFHGATYWVGKHGALVFVALYHGERSERVALFESTGMQLLLPPVGIKSPHAAAGTVIPLCDEIGVRAGDVIDHLDVDAAAQRFLRLGIETTDQGEFLKIELTAPEFAHCIINPADSAYRQMFASQGG